MKVKKPKISEREVQKQITDYLKMTGFEVYRLNNGATWNAKSQAYVFHGNPGVSDVLAIKSKLMIFVEVKSPTGKLSEDQTKFLELVNGVEEIMGICCHNIDELFAKLSQKK